VAIKTFEIEWEGATQTVEFEDDITFGELENILNKCLDLTEVNKPKVNIPLYRQLISSTVIVKAPFPVKDVTAIRNLKASVAKKVMQEVMKSYPLMKYMEEWVETFVGEIDEIENNLQSTTSSQGNSVGQKTK
tara:strand:- start:6130 stop:6528 length:399 start_codon:yes stop_codon:yes gene_type:complete